MVRSVLLKVAYLIPHIPPFGPSFCTTDLQKLALLGAFPPTWVGGGLKRLQKGCLVPKYWGLNLIARYEEGGSYPKPGSWANCDEFAPQYQFFPRYGGANSSQLAQLLGFGYDPRSSFLAIKL